MQQQLAAQAFENVTGQRSRCDYGELITPQAIGFRAATAKLLQHHSKRTDRPVADRVAVKIVDRLEPVEIEQRDRELAVGRCLVLDIAMQRAPVGQAAQAVGKCHVFQLASLAPFAA